jgi:hypothetical protein
MNYKIYLLKTKLGQIGTTKIQNMKRVESK